MATHFLCCGHYSQKKKPWSCVVRMVSIEAEKPPTGQMRPTSDTGLKAVKEIKNGTFFILTCVLAVPLTAGDRIVGLCSGECQPGRLSPLLNGLFVCLARHTEMAEEMKIHSSSEQLPTEWRAICWVPVESGTGPPRYCQGPHSTLSMRKKRKAPIVWKSHTANDTSYRTVLPPAEPGF